MSRHNPANWGHILRGWFCSATSTTSPYLRFFLFSFNFLHSVRLGIYALGKCSKRSWQALGTVTTFSLTWSLSQQHQPIHNLGLLAEVENGLVSALLYHRTRITWDMCEGVTVQYHLCFHQSSSLSICSDLWDNYTYFLPTYWSAVTFKTSYSNANQQWYKPKEAAW